MTRLDEGQRATVPDDSWTPVGSTVKRPENRLAKETSPYLLQHARNPVDWNPWDEPALEMAREQNKPIFLSIGYSACHWCHVMERESFEDEAIASIMNANFINIKVDREERPDLDEIYMNAVVAMTGRGGWPMSVFLTPDLRPFYGGTYFPPRSRHGVTGFFELLKQVAAVWRRDRAEVLQNAEHIANLVQTRLASAFQPGTETDLTPGLRAGAVKQLEKAYDRTWGGWGSAPKFPSPPSVSLLLREFQRGGNRPLLEMAEMTLQRMALGGIHDHIGGGFHRYSVDDQWLVPHFEKMLYDNAQLACAYLEAWQVTKNDFYKRVCFDTLRYLLRDMQGPHGGFYTSEDADSGGEEGRYYLWTRDEIIGCLGPGAGGDFCTAYNIRENGNFSSNESYHREKNIVFQSSLESRDIPGIEEHYSILRGKLLEVRRTRPRPDIDDKVITAWNALAISALAKAAFTWDCAEFREAACNAGLFLKDNLFSGGTLYRTWRLGSARFPGYLDDYAFTANAFIDLYECTGDFAWLSTARQLAEIMVTRFQDKSEGGFYSTASSHLHLLARAKPLHDTAEPSANALAALALARLGHFFDLPDFRQLAETALSAAAPAAARAPLGFLNTILSVDFLIEPPLEIVFVGPMERNDIQALKQVLAQSFVPCRMIAWSQRPEDPSRLPLCASKDMQDNAGTVFVCAKNTCFPPEVTPAGFGQLLQGLRK